MQRLSQSIGKMFVILALLFGSPPLVSLQRLGRRPRVALVATCERRDTDPLALGDAGAGGEALWLGRGRRGSAEAAGTFFPVRAA